MLNLRDAKGMNPTGGSLYPLSHPNMVFMMQPIDTGIGSSTEIASVVD